MEKLIEDFSLGLFFWQTLLFLAFVFLLWKYAWKPILSAINDREEGIKDALAAAEEAKKEMQNVTADNEKLLKEARAEREILLKEAREIKPDVDILIISAWVSDDVAEEDLKLGATDYAVKPMDLKAISLKFANILDKRGQKVSKI